MLIAGDTLAPPPRRKVKNLHAVARARVAHAHEVPPRFATLRSTRGVSAKARGRRYERQVLDRLASELVLRPEFDLIQRPWLLYEETRNITGFVQPDAIVLRERKLFAIVEIKLTHTIDAYWQLASQYLPLAELIWPQSDLPPLLLEITKSYDGLRTWPVDYRLLSGLRDIFTTEARVAVLQLARPESECE